LWDYYHSYLEQSGPLTRFAFKKFAKNLRLWDLATANRVTSFVANSNYVKQRIATIYRREAEVIYPPVDTEKFSLSCEKDDYYLFLGQLVGYKRADIAIEAFRQNGKPLMIIGGGKAPKNLPKNITHRGFVSDSERYLALSRARALIFPGEEDFGIVPVESLASGTPVIAYGRGGALETISEGVSGLFFYQQTAAALNEAIIRFENCKETFKGEVLQNVAHKFNKKNFIGTMQKKISTLFFIK
jgi:glycosyltransferase involved in cell wall biosynthesis